MHTIYKWRVYCETDSTVEYLWAETEPSNCPVNSAHTINSSLTAIVDSVSSTDVDATIVETSLTTGRLRGKGFSFPVAATEGEQIFSASIPYHIDAVSASWRVAGWEEGDYLTVDVTPGPIGLVDNAGGYSAADTTLKVDISVLDNCSVGHYVTFGANTEMHLITTRDAAANTITVEQYDGTAGLSFDINDNEAVILHVLMLDKWYLNEGQNVVGSTKTGGSGIPANMPVNLIFNNSSNTAKTLYMCVELLYGDV